MKYHHTLPIAIIARQFHSFSSSDHSVKSRETVRLPFIRYYTYLPLENEGGKQSNSVQLPFIRYHTCLPQENEEVGQGIPNLMEK